MSWDIFSLMSNGVHHDDATTADEWAILGISYGFITDALGAAIPVVGRTKKWLINWFKKWRK